MSSIVESVVHHLILNRWIVFIVGLLAIGHVCILNRAYMYNGGTVLNVMLIGPMDQ